jgi:dTDP-4-amino-4,6-dideoxygalactose transaminase
LSLKHLKDFFSAIDKQKEIKEFFKDYTGKKYILPTFSCRSALYLAYKSLDRNGEVITSPLTCLTAILPITHSGNNPVFTDIDPSTLNINPELIENKISDNTIAIQVIHFAGYPCEMDKITEITKQKNLSLIEDCAQSFGAKYMGRNVGSFGDVSCFSLAKNLYGIAGGILATDDEKIYQIAKKNQTDFEDVSSFFLYYRFIRNYLKTKSDKSLFRNLHKKLIDLKDKTKNKSQTYFENDIKSLTNYLRKPDKRIYNISWSQIQSLENLHRRRINKANIYLEKINRHKNIKTPQNRNEIERSFVKFYISGDFNSQRDIEILNKLGIEAKHLEEEYGVYYQERFDKNPLFTKNNSLKECVNYLTVHDKLISLPLSEEITENEINNIIEALRDINKN